MPFDNGPILGNTEGMSKSTRKQPNLVEQLRTAILASDMQASEIADSSGVDRAVLSRFLSQQRGLNLETAARLAWFLELELAPKRQWKGGVK